MIDWLTANIPPWVWITLIVHGAVLGTVAYLILLERKVASWVQDRIGPNRTGLGFGIIPVLKDLKMWGLGQPLADGLKFIVKEDYKPKHVDAILFTLAPCIMMLVIVVSIAVIPWGGIKGLKQTTTVPAGTQDVKAYIQTTLPAFHRLVAEPTPIGNVITDATEYSYLEGWDFQIANLNIGVLFVIAVLSLAVYGVVIGGYASNNKYSFLGGLRATANMVSYEIPLGLSILCIVLMFGTLDMGELVSKQAHYWFGIIPAWNVFTQPITFVLFLICIHAEANRAPFDLAECEQELVGGYHTEYSSMRFALFFLAEYAGMITTSCVCVALFFGGWHIPWLDRIPAIGGYVDFANNPAVTDSFFVCILRSLVFFGKAIFVLFVFMWVRWSLPRFRFDQLMDIAWRGLIPVSLALTLGTALLVRFTGGRTLDGVEPKDAAVFFAMNIVVVVGMLIFTKLLPAPPPTNRRLKVAGSRFNPPVSVAVSRV
jgi:NADH-quinone oxidoreductase subunit H